MAPEIVVIGGDAAGMSAAAKLKRDLPDAQVTVFEKGEHISYSACGMPYWIAGVIEDERSLVVMTPEVARKRRGIDVRIHHTVTAIDRQAKTVTVSNAQGESFSAAYDYLVIATGARPTQPPITGIDLPGVFAIRSLSDGQRIHAYLDTHTVRHATIVGGGYIGVEMAEALRDRDIAVSLVEMLPQLMPNFDSDMVEAMTAHVAEKGVEIRLEQQVKSIDVTADRLRILVGDSGTALATDLVIVATGVRPNRELAEEAGLRLGKSGAIWVDRHMRTSDPAIFAAGDCVEHVHLVTHQNAWIPLATSANKGGRLAGDNIVNVIHGEPLYAFPGILGTAVVKVFDFTMATTGLTEHAAIQSAQFGAQGEFVGSARIENHEKAGYWPGVEKIAVKLVFDTRSGRVLGGQLAGKDGVNKRIDIIATAISAGMTLADVAMLDLSYAPPYSPTYDPIHIAANVGQRDVNPTRQFQSSLAG